MASSRDVLLLVAPPTPGLLAGFASSLMPLASMIEQELPEIDVHLIDFSDATTHRCREVATEILAGVRGRAFVGVTTTTATYRSALTVAEVFKDISREVIVIFGGHHASPQDELVMRLHNDVVDVVVRGEGELALVQFIRWYPDLDRVPNLTYVAGDEIRRTPNAPLLQAAELDRLGPIYQPAGEGLHAPPGKFGRATYISARGCPLSCHFCAVANQRIRAKSVGAVVQDLAYLIEEFGYSNFAIEDNFFAHSPGRTLELCTALRNLRDTYHFTWDCQTRVESMRRPDVVEMMAVAGCVAVYLGVEALTSSGLRYLGKTANPDNYLRGLEELVVPSLLSARMGPYLNLQVGLPGETAEERAETMRRMAALGRQADRAGGRITIFPQLHVLYPGTRHFAEAVTEQRFGPQTWRIFEDFTAWEEEQQPVLRWMGERFAHGTGGIPLGIVNFDRGGFDIDPEAVTRINGFLDSLAELRGIDLFRYGSYLTPHANLDFPTVSKG